MLKSDVNNTFLNTVRPSLIHAKWIHKIQYTKPPQGVGDEKTCQNLYQKKKLLVCPVRAQTKDQRVCSFLLCYRAIEEKHSRALF